MEPQNALGFSHFLAQADGVAKTLLVLLLAMSVATWYLIVTKAWTVLTMRQRSRAFLEFFWNAPSLDAVARHLETESVREPFGNLAQQAIRAARHHERHGAGKLNEAGSSAEFLTRAMRRVIDEETARFESGLTVLASIGSTAPFIGLFGTVWGVYGALIGIGVSGQGTLDKVAGPVGEALIMTALGLAVAIPAVLAYNFAVRRNRVVLARLDAFAHDLYAVLTTGSHVADTEHGPSVARAAATPGVA